MLNKTVKKRRLKAIKTLNISQQRVKPATLIRLKCCLFFVNFTPGQRQQIKQNRPTKKTSFFFISNQIK